jgi:hypothetical protein
MFNTIISETSVPGPPYVPTQITSAGTYYWALTSRDLEGNLSSFSDVWRIDFEPTMNTVTIFSPEDGSTYQEDDVIYFTGSAITSDGEPIVANSLIWSSDIDGTIGVGGSFDAILSVGTHVVTLTAEVDEFTYITDFVNLTVTPIQ